MHGLNEVNNVLKRKRECVFEFAFVSQQVRRHPSRNHSCPQCLATIRFSSWTGWFYCCKHNWISHICRKTIIRRYRFDTAPSLCRHILLSWSVVFCNFSYGCEIMSLTPPPPPFLFNTSNAIIISHGTPFYGLTFLFKLMYTQSEYVRHIESSKDPCQVIQKINRINKKRWRERKKEKRREGGGEDKIPKITHKGALHLSANTGGYRSLVNTNGVSLL